MRLAARSTRLARACPRCRPPSARGAGGHRRAPRTVVRRRRGGDQGALPVAGAQPEDAAYGAEGGHALGGERHAGTAGARRSGGMHVGVAGSGRREAVHARSLPVGQPCRMSSRYTTPKGLLRALNRPASSRRQVRNSRPCNMRDQMKQHAQKPPTAPASILLRSTRSLAQ
jgi:hypothetical protein